MDVILMYSHTDGRNPDLHDSHSDNEMTLQGEKDIAASSNNENTFEDHEFLNLEFGEVGSQFHIKD